MHEQRDPQPAAEPTEARGGSRLTAYDSAVARDLLPNLTDEQLKQIPILPPGVPVDSEHTCLDLADPAVPERVVVAGTVVAENALLVPRGEVDDQLWNKLKGEPVGR
jgi:hypothetical protein